MQHTSVDVNPGFQQRPQTSFQAVNDTASNEVTASFIRKVLCSHQFHVAPEGKGEPPPIEELLPPLTSSNAVDLQLYAFISILIKEYVYTWYTRISPDHVFVSEVVQIIAHCTRSLEERARTIDLESLILDDIAGLLEAHVLAHAQANRATKTQEPSSPARVVYHTLRPHPALKINTQEQGRNVYIEEHPDTYSAYRQLLAQSLLAVLLPTEDLQNPCLRALVAEVTADLILGNFIGHRISNGVFIYDIICKASNLTIARFNIQIWAKDISRLPPDRLSRFGLLATQTSSAHSLTTNESTFSYLINMFLEYVPVAVAFIRLALQFIRASAFVRPTGRTVTSVTSTTTFATKEESVYSNEALTTNKNSQTVRNTYLGSSPKPIVQYRIWSCGATIIDLASKMPWVSAVLSLIQYLLLFGPLQLGKANSRIDRIIAHHVVSPLFPLSKHLPTILLNLRLALFPGNALPPRSEVQSRDPQDPDATSNDVTALSLAKRAAAFAILNLIPQPLAKIYFAVPSSKSFDSVSPVKEMGAQPPNGRQLSREEQEVEWMVAGVEEMLDAFSDEYMNRHLALAVVERVLVALVPELAEGKTVAELLADRGIDPGIDFDVASAVNHAEGVDSTA